MKQQIPVSVLLAAFCCLMALVFFVYQLASPVTIPEIPAAQAGVEQAPAEDSKRLSAQLPDPALYSEIAKRPVFSPSRRPTASPATANMPTNQPQQVNFSLIGVINAPNQKLALVQQMGNTTTIILHQGSIIAGWTVSKINGSSILVESGSETKLLKIAQ